MVVVLVAELLLVCTANRCRSPIAEALLRVRLSADPGLSVQSAGLLPGGLPVPGDALVRMDRLGVDLSGHRSVQVSDTMLVHASLILVMTRHHARLLIDHDRRLRSRCFTIKDFVRRTSAVHEHFDLTADPGELLRDLDRGRRVTSLLGSSPDDDVADPMGRSASVWDTVVSELDVLTDQLARTLAGPQLLNGASSTALRD